MSTEPAETNAKILKQRGFGNGPSRGGAHAGVGARPAIVPYFRVASPFRGPRSTL
jgi:hypothetical protein